MTKTESIPLWLDITDRSDMIKWIRSKTGVPVRYYIDETHPAGSNTTKSFKLQGDIGDWLEDKGHDGEVILYCTLMTYSIVIRFDDHQLGMLFKLTWM